MAWVKIDVAILDNQKIMKVGALGFAMHVAAITWCGRNLTDGYLPFGKLDHLIDHHDGNGEKWDTRAIAKSGAQSTSKVNTK